MTNREKAYIYVALSVLLWSTVASAFKLVLRELDFVQVLFFASWASLISLFAVIVMQGRLRRLKNQSGKQLAKSALLGLLNPFIYYLLLFKAYYLLPAQEAQPLNWTWPIVLSLLSIPLLKQKLKGRSIAGVAVSFLGVLIISTGGNPASLRFTNIEGDILAISSSLVWAMFWILNLRDERDPVIKLFLCFMFGVVYNTLGLVFLSGFVLPNIRGLFSSVYIGMFEMGITFIFWLKALDLSKDSAMVGNFAYLTPFISLIFIHYIVGETIAVSSVAGLTLIVAGILLGSVRKQLSVRD